jgi:ParB family chromosome partitioning protein
MAKRKSLGRGLEVLLGTETRPADASPESELREIPVDLLERGRYQPRLDMRPDSLAELAESIRSQGLVQPIVVRRLTAVGDETRYEIVAGERRWRAAQMAGLGSVPALVKDIPDRAAVAVALIENIQRENLNPLEESRALQRLVDEFEMTHAEAAEAVGRSRVAVSNLLRLLELPEELKSMLERRELDMGHARALLSLQEAEDQLAVARRVAKEGWSVRETERAVRRLLQRGEGSSRKPAGEAAVDPDARRLQTELAERLGAPVEIQLRRRGGRLVIRYHSNDELQGIVDRIK